MQFEGWERPDEGVLFVVTGPSGSGKTTLLREALAKVPHLHFSVSVTTRSPRTGEVDGRDYRFVSREEFDALVESGGLLEHAHVYGEHYGTPRAPVEEAIGAGDSVLLDIDPQGAAQVRRAWPDVVTIFVLPPSKEALEDRLRGRATDSEEVIRRRVEQAWTHLRECGHFDYLVMNDHLESAKEQFLGVLAAELLRRNRRETWVRRLGGA